MIVALRVVLEHARLAEVEFRDGELGKRAARLAEVPACGTRAKFEEWVKGRAKNGPTSLQAGSDMIKRVESLQPFNRRDADEHPLARLALHTNHSKHRTPAMTAVRIAAMYDET